MGVRNDIRPSSSSFKHVMNTETPGPNTTGLLETLFIYICSRLAKASIQALYNISSSPVVLGPGLGLYLPKLSMKNKLDRGSIRSSPRNGIEPHKGLWEAVQCGSYP